MSVQTGTGISLPRWALAMGVIFLIILITLPLIGNVIGPTADTVRTAAATDTGLTCTTGASATSCTITLTAAHQHFDTTGMTVKETAPSVATVTGSTTVGADHLTLTITGLASATTYTFTVNYLKAFPGEKSDVNDLMRLLSPIWLVVLFGILFMTGWWAISSYQGGRLKLIGYGIAGAFAFYFFVMPIMSSFANGLAGTGGTGLVNGLFHLVPLIMLFIGLGWGGYVVMRAIRQ